ncbi:unnamed protein product [Brachionus calyciflorus]|uniref:WAP domain-containing protein n=1 Tax=Brachionus calyciflorus TaxID=104777 RepID=A0A813V4G9_9BILA|nr:unnamed protein product [Brachionus calyciflorus]
MLLNLHFILIIICSILMLISGKPAQQYKANLCSGRNAGKSCKRDSECMGTLKCVNVRCGNVCLLSKKNSN